MEKGLSFLEFNYMIMQSYDFLELFKRYGCNMQFGGDDQWSNMLGGTELIRRKLGKDAYAMTITLLLNSEGKKMGKTAKGTLWVDKEKTPVYDFYQYFINQKDEDVEKLLTYFTEIDIAEIKKIVKEDIRAAKRLMAYEITKIIHGEEEAKIAQNASDALFGGEGNIENAPKCELSKVEVENGLTVIDALTISKLTTSKSEARRNIEQGGITLNGEKVLDINRPLKLEDFSKGYAILKRGKKSMIRLELI